VFGGFDAGQFAAFLDDCVFDLLFDFAVLFQLFVEVFDVGLAGEVVAPCGSFLWCPDACRGTFSWVSETGCNC